MYPLVLLQQRGETIISCAIRMKGRVQGFSDSGTVVSKNLNNTRTQSTEKRYYPFPLSAKHIVTASLSSSSVSNVAHRKDAPRPFDCTTAGPFVGFPSISIPSDSRFKKSVEALPYRNENHWELFLNFQPAATNLNHQTLWSRDASKEHKTATQHHRQCGHYISKHCTIECRSGLTIITL